MNANGKGSADSRSPNMEARRRNHDLIFGKREINPALRPENEHLLFAPTEFVRNPLTGAWHVRKQSHFMNRC